MNWSILPSGRTIIVTSEQHAARANAKSPDRHAARADRHRRL
jgi:hypothetical protein